MDTWNADKDGDVAVIQGRYMSFGALIAVISKCTNSPTDPEHRNGLPWALPSLPYLFQPTEIGRAIFPKVSE